jgi:hypothetical protein
MFIFNPSLLENINILRMIGRIQLKMIPLSWLISSLLTAGCSADKKFEYPVIYTGDITNLSEASATFNAIITNEGDLPILECGFVWGVHPSPDTNSLKIVTEYPGLNTISAETNIELLPGKTYFARAYIKTDRSVTYGKEVSFYKPGTPSSIGNWNAVNLGSSAPGCEYPNTIFAIDNKVYIVDEGSLYVFDFSDNSFQYILSNPDFLSVITFSAVVNHVVYVFAKTAFYRFDPNSNSFSKLADLNGNTRYDPVGFSCGENIYIGLGTRTGFDSDPLKDFWQYNTITDTWRELESFPGQWRAGPFSFFIGKEGYLGGGYNYIDYSFKRRKDLWSFSTEKNKWLQKADIPFVGLVALESRDKGYCYNNKLFYEYDPVYDTWDMMKGLEADMCKPMAFAMGQRLFIGELRSEYPLKYINIWEYEK